MRELDCRVGKLETTGRFVPDVANLSDSELAGLLIQVAEDPDRRAQVIDRMSLDQLRTVEAALTQTMREKGELEAEAPEAACSP